MARVFHRIIVLSARFPMTHVTTLMRALWMGESPSQHLTDVAVLLGILVAGILISAKIFRWE